MAKGAYIGIADIARKIKKGYIGVNGIAKKIKKAYVGVDGTARLCWSGGEIKYKGTGIISLAETRSNLTGAATKNHAFFFGGTSVWNNSSGAKNTVEAFDKNLTRYTAPNMYSKQYDVPCGAIGNYAISSASYGEKLYTYDDELTSQLIVDLNQTEGMAVASPNPAVMAGDQLVFNAVKYGSSTDYIVTVDENLTVSTKSLTDTYLSYATIVTSFNGSAVYGSQRSTSQIFRISETLTEQRHTDLMYGYRRQPGCFAVAGEHLLIAGGAYDNGDYDEDCNYLDIVDKNWTAQRGDGLPVDGTQRGASLGEYGIIAFGYRQRNITVYNADITVVLQQTATYGRSSTIPVTLGENTLFAGGYGNYMNQASDDEFSSIELFSIE